MGANPIRVPGPPTCSMYGLVALSKVGTPVVLLEFLIVKVILHGITVLVNIVTSITSYTIIELPTIRLELTLAVYNYYCSIAGRSAEYLLRVYPRSTLSLFKFT